MSVLERLLANAALRDEAGRLHSPEARAHPPSGVSQGVWVWNPGWVVCLHQAVPPVSLRGAWGEGGLGGLPGKAGQWCFPEGGRAGSS